MTFVANFISTAILTYGAHSAAACLVALAFGRILRRPQDRDLAWKAALVLPLLTAGTVLASSQAGAERMRVDLARTLRQAGIATLPGRQVMVRVLDENGRRFVERNIDDPVMSALAITTITIAALCILVIATRLVIRRRALARAIVNRKSAGAIDGVTVSIAESLASPVALARREICLPEMVMHEFPARHRDTLVAHEMAHIARRDPYWFAFVEVAATLSAFQPLVFVVAKHFRRDVELICDEFAVRRTQDAPALIAALAMLASPFDANSSLHGFPTAYDGSPLVARASRIATTIYDTPAASPRLGLLAVAGVLVALAVLPVVSPAPRLDEFPADVHVRPFTMVTHDSLLVIRRGERVTAIRR
jgi:beta-lactamase regulating signal transducer with metallopeptidase domain